MNPKTEPVDPASVDDNELGRRRAVVVLEVLAGLRGVSNAAQELDIALQAYYQLEERAVKRFGHIARPLFSQAFLPASFIHLWTGGSKRNGAERWCLRWFVFSSFSASFSPPFI